MSLARIHRILSQITLLRGQLHGFPGRLRKCNLVKPDRAIHIKQNAAGVLADGLRFLFGQFNVALDDFQRILGNRTLLFLFQ